MLIYIGANWYFNSRTKKKERLKVNDVIRRNKISKGKKRYEKQKRIKKRKEKFDFEPIRETEKYIPAVDLPIKNEIVPDYEDDDELKVIITRIRSAKNDIIAKQKTIFEKHKNKKKFQSYLNETFKQAKENRLKYVKIDYTRNKVKETKIIRIDNKKKSGEFISAVFYHLVNRGE